MFERPLSRSALVAAFLGCALFATAQLTTNGPALQRMSRTLTKQAQAEEAQARAWANLNGVPLRQELPGGRIVVLDGFRNGRPVYLTTFGLGAAVTIGVNRLWPGGDTALNLTGTGITMGIWEAGGNPEVTHREFTNRVVIQDGNNNFSDHATHVAGIMAAAGVNARARGMAYASNLDAWDASNDAGEAAAAAARTTTPIRVSNHSYGPGAGWMYGLLGDDRYVWFGDTRVSAFEDYTYGFYDSEGAVWDTIAYNAPFYLIVQAAGNSRNSGPPTQPVTHWVWNFDNGEWAESDAVRSADATYDNLPGGMTNAKNILTVGAVNEIPGGYDGPDSVISADFSSWGPSDDGRIKPDVVAPGVDVFSAVNGNGYGAFSGTSMAAPSAAGAVGLLMQYYRQTHSGADMRASTMRGLLIHTADEAGANPGPDYSFGWGLVNAATAAQHIQGSLFNPNSLREVVLGTGQTLDIPIAVDDTGAPVKVTIAWTDPAGTPTAPALDPRTPMLVNDLDLRVIRNGDGTTFLPWTLNPSNPSAAAVPGDNVVDNVEQIVLENPQAGVHTIRIGHKGTLRGGAQIVSIIITAPQPSGFSDLDVTPDTVVGGAQNSVGTLTLREPSSTPTDVELYSSNPAVASVPSSITVPANTASVDFPIVTRSVRPTNGNLSVPITIIASSSIGARSTVLTVQPILVSDFSLSTNSVVGGNTLTGTIRLNAPAPASGAAVAITTNLPRVARSVRNWVTVRRGETTATFTIRTFSVPEAKDVVVSASRLGGIVTENLTVNRPGIHALTASPNVVNGTSPFTLRVELDGPAPANGAVVQLSSSNPSLLAVPTSVVIPAGRLFTTVNLAAQSAGGGAQVTITASRFSATTSTTVTLN